MPQCEWEIRRDTRRKAKLAELDKTKRSYEALNPGAKYVGTKLYKGYCGNCGDNEIQLMDFYDRLVVRVGSIISFNVCPAFFERRRSRIDRNNDRYMEFDSNPSGIAGWQISGQLYALALLYPTDFRHAHGGRDYYPLEIYIGKLTPNMRCRFDTCGRDTTGRLEKVVVTYPHFIIGTPMECKGSFPYDREGAMETFKKRYEHVCPGSKGLFIQLPNGGPTLPVSYYYGANTRLPGILSANNLVVVAMPEAPNIGYTISRRGPHDPPVYHPWEPDSGPHYTDTDQGRIWSEHQDSHYVDTDQGRIYTGPSPDWMDHGGG